MVAYFISTSINKLQVMQDAALRTATGCTQDTNIHLHDETLILGDGCDLASTLCKYDLRKGDLFVLSLARVRRVRRGSISLEPLMYGGGVRSMLLLPLVTRCLETIDVCMWRMIVFMSVVVIVWGSVGMFVV